MDNNFKCALCSGVFDTNAEQRKHMQSPWHIWNLKRRIASLPPLPQHIFEEQVVSGQASASGMTEDPNPHESPEKGDILGSDESTEVGFDSDEIDSDEGSESDFDPYDCLFCPISSSAIDANLQHMQKAHGLFIPDPESRLDAHALLVYLSSLITSLHECLYCGAQKNSEEGAKAHMLDKGHCKLSDEEMRHLHEFYVPGDNEEEVGEDDGLEGKEKDVAVVQGGDVDGHLAAAIEALEDLHLPSGKTIGHRSRLRYFHRQHRATVLDDSALVPVEGTPENPEDENKDKGLAKAAKAKYNSHQLAVQANTEKGLIGLPEDRKRALRAAEKKILKAEGRRRNEYRAVLEKQGNKQKHFRNDVPGTKLG